MLTSNLFLLSLGVLALVVCAVLGAVLYFAANSAKRKPSPDRKIVRLRADSLRGAFRQAVELVESNIASRAERYNIPWVMVLSEGEDPPALPIAQSGVASVLGADAASPAATQGISWHFFDRGIVIDIKAAYLGSPDDDSDEKPWDEFLSLCRSYRPQRPFDSVVITVPAASLLASDTDARLQLVRQAKLAHRRLWLAQNRFAMRFAVYVVVTDCEVLSGFGEFARALPEPSRASMLGWSSPFDLSATYQSDWVGTAINSITSAVSDASAELFTLDTGALDAQRCLLLPSRIESMQAQLQSYVDELLRPSAYHEPFFFRGIYLTGDSGELAEHTLRADPIQVLARVEPIFDPYAERISVESADVVDDLKEGAHGITLARGDDRRMVVAAAHVSDLMRQPAFLRDLFEKKIFLEYGLTRPSRTQYLARPMMNRLVRVGGISVLSVWGLCIVIAGLQLHRRNGDVVSALHQMHAAAQERVNAAQNGQDLPTDWYRRKALGLIAMNEGLRLDRAWGTWAMPGSWPAVDSLNDRVNDSIAREFGETAVSAIQREMYAKVAQLTQVSRDPTTGQLIVDADCMAPRVADNVSDSLSLGVDEQAEMIAMQRYVGAVDQFQSALQALQQLQTPGQGNADALRRVARYAFGAELSGDVSGSLPYFYQKGNGDPVSGNGGRMGGVNLDVPALQQALRCSFDKGAQKLDDRLFLNNPLLQAEGTVRSTIARMSTASAEATSYTQWVNRYRAVIAAINLQQDLLGGGKGGWMHQAQFNPGAAYDRVMTHANQNTLLGADAVSRAKSRTNAAFLGFKNLLAADVGTPDSGFVWNDKEARYVLSPDRAGLRDSLSNLLNQPFMVDVPDQSLPAPLPGTTLKWDGAQLDQAVALGDLRKRFLTDGLKALPAGLMASVQSAVDRQFARVLFDQTAGAAFTASAGLAASAATDSASFDATHTRLLRIQSMLSEMGANDKASALGQVISRDALAHLQLVDQDLFNSDLYATTNGAYTGGAHPVLAAFGLTDAASLGGYLAEQSARATALGKQAAVYLSALDPADASSAVAQNWQAIDVSLDRYQLKNPNSSLLMLEQFIQAAANADVSGGNCLASFPGRPGFGGTGDYFSDIHRRLYDRFLARCTQSNADALQHQWASFAAAFNQGVAGSAPFQMARLGSAPSAGSILGGTSGFADFGEVGRVLQRYQNVAQTLQQAHGAGKNGIAMSTAMRQFNDHFARVNAFLAPLYPAGDGAPTGYDVNVDFRVNRLSEIAGNQIIDWTLQFGNQSLSSSDTPHSLHWDYGMPVSLVLRVAKNSPLTVVGDPHQGALSTDGQTLTWQFSDPWALITLLSAQDVPDDTPRGSVASEVLKFQFPLVSANPSVLSDLPKHTDGQVFLRLTVLASGKKVPLRWPGTFPARVPEWR